MNEKYGLRHLEQAGRAFTLKVIKGATVYVKDLLLQLSHVFSNYATANSYFVYLFSTCVISQV